MNNIENRYEKYYTTEFRQQFLNDFKNLKTTEIKKKYNKHWLKLKELHKFFLKNPTDDNYNCYKRYTVAFKEEVLDVYNALQSYDKTAKIYKLSSATVRSWNNKIKNNQPLNNKRKKWEKQTYKTLQKSLRQKQKAFFKEIIENKIKEDLLNYKNKFPHNKRILVGQLSCKGSRFVEYINRHSIKKQKEILLNLGIKRKLINLDPNKKKKHNYYFID